VLTGVALTRRRVTWCDEGAAPRASTGQDIRPRPHTGPWLEGIAMAADEYQPVRVSRRIEAPAGVIFQVLADPRRHLELDGSGMLRGAVTQTPVSGTGDVFVMRMYYSEHGNYEMDNHVVEFEQDRRIVWEPVAGKGHPDTAPGSTAAARWGHRWGYELVPDGPGATVVTEIYDCSRAPEAERAEIDNGRVWAASMARTLERLDRACTGRAGGGAR
jgi:hypothetical protein